MPATVIRIANHDDAPAIQAIYAPVVLNTAISFEETAPSVEEIHHRLDATLPHYPYLVAEQEGYVVGYAYASQHRARPAYRWSVDTTVYIAEACRRQGVGRALYKTLLPILKAQHFHAAYAAIALPNDSSVALHEALGVALIGVYPEVGFKLGKWHDVGHWRCALSMLTEPREPIAFADVKSNDVNAQTL
jgi:phosphinothricin acetyltransferase